MAKKHEPSTPAAGADTPWKGRLRSHHATPLSSPTPRVPSRSSRIRNEDEDARKFKTPARRRDEGDGSVRRSLRVLARRSGGQDAEHPIVPDETDKECQVRGNQSAITPLRRSARFQRGDKSLRKPSAQKEIHQKRPPRIPNLRGISQNRETQNAVTKDKKQEDPTQSSQRIAALKSSARMKKHEELHTLYEDSQDVPARRMTPRASCEKSDMLNEDDEECEVRGNQSAITPLRRSARFQRGDASLRKPSVQKEIHQKRPPRIPNSRGVAQNRETQNAVMKDKKQEDPTRSSQRIAALKSSARMEKHEELQTLYEDPQDVPARRKTPRASCRKSEVQGPKTSRCEDPARKRKRDMERKPTTRKQSHMEPKSHRQEIALTTEPRNIIHNKGGNDPSSIVQPKISDDILTNTKGCNEELSGNKEGVQPQLCASDDWTDEQDLTLRQAYFTARPSPHFWKKVSKMVPGKSAQECFNRVHADLSTPAPMAPRPRTSKTQFSPLGHFTLSDPKLPNLLEPLAGRRRTAKQTSLAAQKTVKHLLKKHTLIDQAQEADHFSIFETSPSALQLNIPLEDSPGTPDNHLNSFSLHKYSVSSSARKRPLSRLKTKQAEPSPTVLKPVKNVVLHERYINQLSRREVAKKPRKKAAGTKTTDPERPLLEQQAGVVKAAKNALMSEATDFISQFTKLQANSLAHVLENSEDEADDSV